MRRLFSIPSSALVLSILSLVSTQNSTKKICETKECLSAAQNLKESINFEADPCDDFYKYACGNWPKVHENPSLIPGSTIRLRNDENTAELYDFLKKNNTEDEPEAVHKARKLYALCLNKTAYSNQTEPIKTILQKIGLPVVPSMYDVDKNYDYTTVLARAAKLAGIKMYFDLGISANPYNRTTNMIALGKIAPTAELDPTMMPLISKSSPSERAARKISEEEFMDRVVRKMCEGSHSTPCVQWDANTLWAREITIQKVISQRDDLTQIKHKPIPALNSTPIAIYSLKQLQNLTDSIATEVNTVIPKLNWTKYIEETFKDLDNVTLDLSDPTKVQIAIQGLEFIKAITRFIYKIGNVKMIELGLWLEVVSNLLPYVDLKTFEAKHDIDNKEDSSVREQTCAEITKLSFGMAVSYVYATKEKYINAKTEIRQMYGHIRDSFEQIIQTVPWMDDITRQRALKKLHAVKSYIVYPSVIKTTNILNDFYKDVKISDNFYDTMITTVQSRVKKTLSKLNQINDLNEDDWIITPNIVNAMYDPQKNAIIIPAGILGLSIYNHSLRALDYGGLGSIVGHELTHAFDNEGRRFNEIGNIEDWWQPETLNSYKEKAKCFVKAYGNYSTNFGGIRQKVDSKVTLGEDISDNGGFKESLFAYRRFKSEFGDEPILPQFENFTHEQLLTIGFANVWCENPTIASTLLNKFSDHSPDPVRVNGVLKNSEEFSEIWKCPKGSNMNPDSDKCSVW
ncbi:neprilysin-2-like [Planococcus citri]|uniref:neprilysin-2-like n=1 Tax=Planococcus citri TaxID=170843 RepID=UPI0031FA0FD8